MNKDLVKEKMMLETKEYLKLSPEQLFERMNTNPTEKQSEIYVIQTALAVKFSQRLDKATLVLVAIAFLQLVLTIVMIFKK